MKKQLFYFLTTLFCINSTSNIQAQCSIDQVGTIPNYLPYAQLSDFAIAPNNTLYSISYSSSDTKTHLYSTTVPGSWSLITSLTPSTTVKPVINVASNGTVYVFVRDEPAGKVGKVYYLSGSALIQVGPPVSGANIVSDLSIACNSTNEVFVAYTDVSNANKSTVKKWDGVSAWVPLGGGGGTVSAGAGYHNSLIIDNTGSPVLAFQSATTGNASAVRSFDGSAWNQVGTPSIGAAATNQKIKVSSSGDYYLGYTETTNNAVVQKYNGSSWAQLGSSISNINSIANSFDLELDPTDMPYFIGIPPIIATANAYRYFAGSWNTIATNISAGNSVSANLSFDTKGNPYFSYASTSANNALNSKTLTSPINITTQPNSLTVCNSNTGLFNIGTSGGTPTYQWQTAIGNIFSNSTSPYTGETSPNLNFIANPSLNLNKLRCIVDAGCKNIISNTATLTVNSITINLTTTNPTCYGLNDGNINSAVFGGTPPYTYNWSGGFTTPNLINVASGMYTLNVQDVTGCLVSSATTLNAPPQITSSFSGNMNICTGSSTTLTITASGGTGGLTYSWAPGGSLSSTTGSVVTANPSSTQTYNVQITDANACVVTNTVMVTVNPLPTVTTSGNATICQGNSTLISASGSANTYVWNPGSLSGASQNVSPSINTTYTVVGTNTTTNCQALAIVGVTVNPLPTANAGPTKTLTCVNTSTTLAGSTVGGFNYSWVGPLGFTSTLLNPTVILPGTYSFNTTSSGACTSTTSTVSVIQNTTAPIPTASNSGTLTCTTNTVALTGGPGTGVTYQWNGPSFIGGTTTKNVVANAAGTFTLKVTNTVNGCTNTAVTSVTQNTVAPNANAGPDQILTCSVPTASLNGSANPPTCTPAWTGGVASGANSYSATVSTNGTYILTVTNPLNGCTANDQVMINTNTVSPIVTAVASNTLDCVNTSINTTATSSAPSSTYLWSGPGILSGANLTSATVNQPGAYTVTVTDITNGCSASSNINVMQNITLPNITAAASSSTLCSGNSSTLTASGAVTYLWNTAQTTASISVSPNATTSYTVSGTGTNGCVKSTTLLIAVNAAPTLAVSGNTTICNGSTSTLTASGATSYTWSAGVNSNTISITPTVTTTYTVDGANSNGCSASTSVVVSIISSKNINGVITNTAGALGGDVILYKYSPFLSQWDSITVVPLTSSYSFTNIDSALYVVRAIPTSTNIQVTYGYNAISWQNASVINHGCANNSNQNIDLISLNNFGVGPGVLTGIVVEASGFGSRMSSEFKPMAPGEPIGGIIVKGGRNPGGQMFVQTITAADGTYSLTGLPLTTGNDSYFIVVDIPGLDTNGTYNIVITGTNTVINDLNFTVDSIYINPIGSITGISIDKSVLENKILLFPNPAKQNVSIQYELLQAANIKIELFDIIGHKVKTAIPNSLQEKNKYTHSINVEDLSNGIYFVRLTINNSITTIKLVISQ